MGEQPPPGGGAKDSPPPSNPLSTTPVQSGGGQDNVPRKMRTFEEIVAEEKKNHNILTVKLTKIVKYVDGKEERPASLNMEDIGEFIFDVVKLDINDCSGISLSTQRYDTKEINLKPNVDPRSISHRPPLSSRTT